MLDYLRDDFYIQMDLTQVRAEMSYLCCGHEVGFSGGLQRQHQHAYWDRFPGNTFGRPTAIEANSQYNLFYRYEFCNGTYCRTWMGLSGHGDGIFGGDATFRSVLEGRSDRQLQLPVAAQRSDGSEQRQGIVEPDDQLRLVPLLQAMQRDESVSAAVPRRRQRHLLRAAGKLMGGWSHEFSLTAEGLGVLVAQTRA